MKKLELSGEDVGLLFTKDNEFPYDWNIGTIVYITFMSAIFGGTIVLEGMHCTVLDPCTSSYGRESLSNTVLLISVGVTTSIMAQVTPSKLNSCFINSGLLATLIGTLGRVLSDSMITFSALLDIHVFIDFVNVTFFPLLFLAMGCLFLVYKYYDKLV